MNTKPKSISAGLLLYHLGACGLRVLLAHPGGPYFANKDEGAWSIPKGLAHGDDVDLLQTAKREFVEETGYDLSGEHTFRPLGTITLKSGKEVHAWAFSGDWKPGRFPNSNTFEIEWPPRSGRKQEFPEIDRAEMFSLAEARVRINERQRPFLDRLSELLGKNTG